MVNLSTKYKVVIVNVVVIGLLLCGQYWIDQQNQVNSKSIESLFNYDLEKEVQAVKDGKSKQTIFEFKNVNGDNMHLEFDSESRKFTSYTNGYAKVTNADIEFKTDSDQILLSGEATRQHVLYTKPIEADKAKVDKWLKDLEDAKVMNQEIKALHAKTFVPGRYQLQERTWAEDATGKKRKKFKENTEIEITDVKLYPLSVHVQVKEDDWWLRVIQFDHDPKYWTPPQLVNPTPEETEMLEKIQSQIKKLEDKKEILMNEVKKGCKFTTVNHFAVEFTYDFDESTSNNLHVTAKREENNYTFHHRTTISKGDFVNNKYSLEIKANTKFTSSRIEPSKLNVETTPGKKVLDEAEKKTFDTLKQKIRKKELYRFLMLVSIVTLVFFVIIFVIFYDEEAKTFVFVIVKNENEFEDNETEQYTPDGANNV